jgi:hypothetical protein
MKHRKDLEEAREVGITLDSEGEMEVDVRANVTTATKKFIWP